MDLYNLPYEVLFNILNNISHEQLINICLTSQCGRYICKDEYLWQRFIYDTYGVRNKLQPEESWYDNFVYITTLFTPQQLHILQYMYNISPALIKNLKLLNNYTEYNQPPGHDEWGSTTQPLTDIILWLSKSKIYSTLHQRYILTPHTTEENAAVKLMPGKDELVTDRSHVFGSIPKTTLNNTGSTIVSNRNNTCYIVKLNRKQLSAITHMYT